MHLWCDFNTSSLAWVMKNVRFEKKNLLFGIGKKAIGSTPFPCTHHMVFERLPTET
jgi:hypothetical protein